MLYGLKRSSFSQNEIYHASEVGEVVIFKCASVQKSMFKHTSGWPETTANALDSQKLGVPFKWVFCAQVCPKCLKVSSLITGARGKAGLVHTSFCCTTIRALVPCRFEEGNLPVTEFQDMESMESIESMDIHGIHGYPWIPWISMDSMDSMDSMSWNSVTGRFPSSNLQGTSARIVVQQNDVWTRPAFPRAPVIRLLTFKHFGQTWAQKTHLNGTPNFWESKAFAVVSGQPLVCLNIDFWTLAHLKMTTSPTSLAW